MADTDFIMKTTAHPDASVKTIFILVAEVNTAVFGGHRVQWARNPDLGAPLPFTSGPVRGGVRQRRAATCSLGSLAATHRARTRASCHATRAHTITRYYVRDRQHPGERDDSSR